MITANEFRIGNKVMLSGLWATITGIVATEKETYFFVNNDEIPLPLNTLDPVPLSGKVVEKCWFYQSEDGFWYEHMATTLYPIYLMQLNGQWQFSLTDPCAIAYWKPIHWLHQLQNLYFALTDEELEIAA